MQTETTNEDMIYCLVVGSRTFDDAESLNMELDALLGSHTDVTIVSGGARGADSFAEDYAKKHGFELKIFKPDWNKYGRAAGPKRNEEMQKYISQFTNRICVAFWDGESRGTASNFNLAKKYNNPLKIVKF